MIERRTFVLGLTGAVAPLSAEGVIPDIVSASTEEADLTASQQAEMWKAISKICPEEDPLRDGLLNVVEKLGVEEDKLLLFDDISDIEGLRRYAVRLLTTRMHDQSEIAKLAFENKHLLKELGREPIPSEVRRRLIEERAEIDIFGQPGGATILYFADPTVQGHWIAFFDDPEHPQRFGWGKTKVEAAQDLIWKNITDLDLESEEAPAA